MADVYKKYEKPVKGRTTKWGTFATLEKSLDEGVEVLVLGELEYTMCGSKGKQYLVTHPDIQNHSGHDDADVKGTPYEGKCSWANHVELVD